MFDGAACACGAVSTGTNDSVSTFAAESAGLHRAWDGELVAGEVWVGVSGDGDIESDASGATAATAAVSTTSTRAAVGCVLSATGPFIRGDLFSASAASAAVSADAADATLSATSAATAVEFVGCDGGCVSALADDQHTEATAACFTAGSSGCAATTGTATATGRTVVVGSIVAWEVLEDSTGRATTATAGAVGAVGTVGSVIASPGVAYDGAAGVGCAFSAGTVTTGRSPDARGRRGYGAAAIDLATEDVVFWRCGAVVFGATAGRTEARGVCGASSGARVSLVAIDMAEVFGGAVGRCSCASGYVFGTAGVGTGATASEHDAVGVGAGGLLIDAIFSGSAVATLGAIVSSGAGCSGSAAASEDGIVADDEALVGVDDPDADGVSGGVFGVWRFDGEAGELCGFGSVDITDTDRVAVGAV